MLRGLQVCSKTYTPGHALKGARFLWECNLHAIRENGEKIRLVGFFDRSEFDLEVLSKLSEANVISRLKMLSNFTSMQKLFIIVFERKRGKSSEKNKKQGFLLSLSLSLVMSSVS